MPVTPEPLRIEVQRCQILLAIQSRRNRILTSRSLPDVTVAGAKKRVKGTLYTFTGSAGALDEYERVRTDLYAGRTPRPKVNDGITVFELCTEFLAAKQQQQESGEITILTWRDYRATCKRVVAYFGQSRSAADLSPEDFEGLRAEFSKTRKLVALGNEILRTRVVFKYGYDAGLLPAPVRFGPLFKQPTAKAVEATGRRIARMVRTKTSLQTRSKNC